MVSKLAEVSSDSEPFNYALLNFLSIWLTRRCLLCDSFLLHWTTNVWGLPWKILKTIEPFSLYIISLENNIPTIGLFWRSRATTVIRPRDTHVENDLSASSQNSIEIHSRDIVFCRLKLIIVHISCWGVSWIHRADPCLYYFEIFWSVLFKFCFALPCIFFFFISIFFCLRVKIKFT